MSYNIALIGNGGVGKTSLLLALEGKFPQRYNPTTGVYVKSLLVNTNRGPINLKLWDYAGQEQFANRNSSDADLSIIMYDLTSKISYKKAHTFWKNYAGNSPTLYVATKNDISEQWVQSNDIKISCRKDPNSVRNLMQKVLHTLTGDSEIVIMDEITQITPGLEWKLPEY
jgi:small GTP-binding protein